MGEIYQKGWSCNQSIRLDLNLISKSWMMHCKDSPGSSVSHLQNWVTSHSKSQLQECYQQKYLVFQATQKICLRRFLASCSVINLCNLFTSFQPLFSPCKKGLLPSLSELILVRLCEALNQYCVFCLTYSWKNILH